jgi:hypothetical protein
MVGPMDLAGRIKTPGWGTGMMFENVRTESVAEAAIQRFAGTASVKLAGFIIEFPCRRNRRTK